MYLGTRNEFSRSRLSKLRAQTRQADRQTDATERITTPHSWVDVVLTFKFQKQQHTNTVFGEKWTWVWEELPEQHFVVFFGIEGVLQNSRNLPSYVTETLHLSPEGTPGFSKKIHCLQPALSIGWCRLVFGSEMRTCVVVHEAALVKNDSINRRSWRTTDGGALCWTPVESSSRGVHLRLHRHSNPRWPGYENHLSSLLCLDV